MNNLFKITYLLVLGLLFAGNYSQAQNTSVICGTDTYKSEYSLEQKMQDSIMQVQMRKYISNVNVQNKSNHDYTIPLIFHLKNMESGSWPIPQWNDSIADAAVTFAINELNSRFNKLNTDTSETRNIFKQYAAGLSIEFKLAHLDENGNCTPGIEPYSSSLLLGDISDANTYDPSMYFNVYVVGRIDFQGTQAFYANNGPGFNIPRIVITKSALLDTTVLTHEFGHALGLKHTFDGGCGGACDVTGDFICDTPPQDLASFFCDTLENTCSNDTVGPSPFSSDVVNQIENYMGYDWACQTMFTSEQVQAMEFYLDNDSANYLPYLSLPSNIIATGVNLNFNPDSCLLSDFVINMDTIPYLNTENIFCQGDTVLFFDNTQQYALPTAWTWTFQGGSPSSSNVQNPQVVYNTPGSYNVSFYASDVPNSTGQNPAETIITISSITAEINHDFIDDFENGNLFNSEWTVENPSNVPLTWSHFTGAGANSNSSIRQRGYIVGGHSHNLISKSFDLTSISEKTLKFDLAYAGDSSIWPNSGGLLEVFYSLTCLRTWESLQVFSEALPQSDSLSLNTTALFPGNFIPNSNDWSSKTIDLTPIGNNSNVIFKFMYKAKSGRNIYIDNINIGDSLTATGISVNDQIIVNNVVVYPNPSSSGAKISFYIPNNVDDLSILVKDVFGKQVTTIVDNYTFNTGQYTINIDEGQILKSGIYFIEFSGNGHRHLEKFIIQ